MLIIIMKHIINNHLNKQKTILSKKPTINFIKITLVNSDSIIYDKTLYLCGHENPKWH